MKILITGSKGFIGSHFLNLLGGTCEVFGCDVVNDYVSPNYFQIDATNADFKEIFLTHQFDACINCAGAASVPDSFLNPHKDFNLNTFLVVKLLDAIRLYNPDCKFINFSSAAVYGNPKHLPVKEDSVLNPLSPYGLHKKLSEEILNQYSTLFKIKTCSVRPFSVYGPGLKKQLFWDLHQKALLSSTLEMWGTGDESRDFIYVDDVVKAVLHILNKADFKGECINIASGIETTISSAVTVFRSLYFKDFKVSFGGQRREGDPINWVADVSVLKSYGFESTISLNEGLTNFIKWLKTEKF